jgi:rfaE bifunctional protein kinase chain/domain
MLVNNHIDSINKLVKIDSKIVFVSGNFNIVHPGHLRLLKYASECGDFLVVGVLNRKSNGAILSEDQRLECVNSISFIDYAFILEDTPERFIEELKPDIVIKGKEHEYSYNSELQYVTKYGGKLLFSSGEMKFSSIDLLKNEFNDLNHFNITHSVEFLTRHNLRFDKMASILSNFSKLKVLVIGDLIVDEYISCDPIGMSQEDPTIVVSPIDSTQFVGGAGIVASHASSLGADVTFFSIIGNDITGDFAKEKLNDYKVNFISFVDENRPTTLKKRYRANNKTLLRVSYLRQNDINSELSFQIFEKIKQQISGVNLLIFSDFNYGCLPQSLVDNIVNLCIENNIKMVADSQSSSQFGDISRFKNMTLITPTEREARLGLRDFDSGLVVLANSLISNCNSQNTIITLGGEGVLISATDSEEGYLTDKIPAMNNSPKDVSGAGDCLLVTTSLALASNCNIWESAYLGSLAAACQVGRIGNIPIKIDDIIFELNK